MIQNIPNKKFKMMFSLAYQSGQFDINDVEKFCKKYKQQMSLCDSFIFIPICEMPKEIGKIDFISMDGKTKEPLKGEDLFKYWCLLGHYISLDSSVPDKFREIAKWASHMDEQSNTNH